MIYSSAASNAQCQSQRHCQLKHIVGSTATVSMSMESWTLIRSSFPHQANQQQTQGLPRKVEVIEPQYKTVYPAYSKTGDSVIPNFYAAMNGSKQYGHMTTYELLSGAKSTTPIKFSRLNSGSIGAYQCSYPIMQCQNEIFFY